MTWSFHVHSNTAFVPAVSTIVIVTILESWWTRFCCPATRDTPSQLTHCFYAVLKPYNCVVLAVYNSKSVQLPYGFYTGHLDRGWVHVYTVLSVSPPSLDSYLYQTHTRSNYTNVCLSAWKMYQYRSTRRKLKSVRLLCKTHGETDI